MAYSNQIPRATDQLNDSQLDLLNNFIAIQQLVDVNHINFNLGIESGKHKQVTLPVNVAPTPTLANEVNVFSQTSALSSLFPANTAALFWQTTNGGPVVNMTSGAIQVGPPITGFTFLPSGLLVKFGKVVLTVGLSQVITYPVAAGTIPVFTSNPYSIQVTNFSLAVNPRVVNLNLLSTTSFTVSVFDLAGAPAGSELFYVAIGVGA